MATPLQYSCLENSRTEEPGGLQSTESQSLDRTEQLHFTSYAKDDGCCSLDGVTSAGKAEGTLQM